MPEAELVLALIAGCILLSSSSRCLLQHCLCLVHCGVQLIEVEIAVATVAEYIVQLVDTSYIQVEVMINAFYATMVGCQKVISRSAVQVSVDTTTIYKEQVDSKSYTFIDRLHFHCGHIVEQ